MIDTIGLQFCEKVILDEKWDFRRMNWKKGYTRIFHQNVTLDNKTVVQYTYLPYCNGGLPLLKVEFSLPKLIYGDNVQMVYNIKHAIDRANSLLPEAPGIPKLDLWTGILYRLDICYNFQVGDLVPWYINTLLFLEYKYRKTRPYTSEGVQYENKQVVLKFYDKARERKDKGDPKGALAASGILRMELELKKLRIKKLTGNNKKPTLRDISARFLLETLENELNELELLGRSIGTVDTTFKILREKYGELIAFTLIGMLKTKMSYPSTELLAQDAGLHPNSIGRRITKKFKENGLPLTLTEHSEPLPPLVIDKEYVLSQANREDAGKESHANA